MTPDPEEPLKKRDGLADPPFPLDAGTAVGPHSIDALFGASRMNGGFEEETYQAVSSLSDPWDSDTQEFVRSLSDEITTSPEKMRSAIGGAARWIATIPEDTVPTAARAFLALALASEVTRDYAISVCEKHQSESNGAFEDEDVSPTRRWDFVLSLIEICDPENRDRIIEIGALPAINERLEDFSVGHFKSEYPDRKPLFSERIYEISEGFYSCITLCDIASYGEPYQTEVLSTQLELLIDKKGNPSAFAAGVFLSLMYREDRVGLAEHILDHYAFLGINEARVCGEVLFSMHDALIRLRREDQEPPLTEGETDPLPAPAEGLDGAPIIPASDELVKIVTDWARKAMDSGDPQKVACSAVLVGSFRHSPDVLHLFPDESTAEEMRRSLESFRDVLVMGGSETDALIRAGLVLKALTLATEPVNGGIQNVSKDQLFDLTAEALHRSREARRACLSQFFDTASGLSTPSERSPLVEILADAYGKIRNIQNLEKISRAGTENRKRRRHNSTKLPDQPTEYLGTLLDTISFRTEMMVRTNNLTSLDLMSEVLGGVMEKVGRRLCATDMEPRMKRVSEQMSTAFSVYSSTTNTRHPLQHPTLSKLEQLVQ